MTAGVILPWMNSGCPDRSRSFTYLYNHYSSRLPVEVYEEFGKLNRAGLRNRAVLSSRFDTAAIVDADVFVPIRQLKFALDWASRRRRLIKPFFTVGYMSRTSTLEWMATEQHEDIDSLEFTRLAAPWPGIHGGAFVMQRSAWLDVGGMDEGFEGWGGEDNAFNEACAKAFGKIGLVKGYAFHLYHPRTEKMSNENRERLMTYTQRDKLLPPHFTRSPR